jgi:hypothetical protein
MSAANRRRGADAERAVVRYLNARGFEARRYLAGDGKQPGDIDWHPLIVIEVKDVRASSWPAWCRQAAKATGPGQLAAVVRRERGNPDVGRWPCRFRWSDAVGLGLHLGGVVDDTVGEDLWVCCYFGDLVAAVREMDA